MKIKPEYKIRKVGETNIIVSTDGINLHGMISVNSTGEFIWKMLAVGAEYAEIVTALAKECEVTENEIADDVRNFILKLQEQNILE